jgi:hypothetical protein
MLRLIGQRIATRASPRCFMATPPPPPSPSERLCRSPCFRTLINIPTAFICFDASAGARPQSGNEEDAVQCMPERQGAKR